MSKVVVILISILGFLLPCRVKADGSGQDMLRTQPLCSEVKSLRTLVDGDFWNLPVIALDGNNQLEICFDWISDDRPWLTYDVTHCDATWRPDHLSELDYMEGFVPVRVEDVEPSFNTFISYYHVSVQFPNEEVRFLVSGNYAIRFHPEDDQDETVAVACFSISEQLATVDGSISGNTDVDFRESHQQVTLEVAWNERKLPYLNAASDLLLDVRQNRRHDTRRILTQPSRMMGGRAYYEHEPLLIFEAQNNWRRFEFTDERYPGIGVDNVRHETSPSELFDGYSSPRYVANLLGDKPRAQNHYIYDQTQNGRFLVHALHVDDEELEAEYFEARFMLDAPASLDEEGIYLIGDFTYGLTDQSTRMEYDAEQGVFTKSLLLKQGAYNYLYRVGTCASGEKEALGRIEGNCYETRNEYNIFVYYKPFGCRYDRLIGTATLK